MTQQEILELVAHSSPDSWEKLDVPSIRSWANCGKSIKGDMYPYVEHSSHSTLAIYRGDIDIALAWGASRNSDFKDPSLKKNPYPNKEAQSIYVDLRYRGQVVAHWIVLLLDNSHVLITIHELVPGSLDMVTARSFRTSAWVHGLCPGTGSATRRRGTRGG